MYFSTQILRLPIAGVDRESAVLFGVTITQLGPVRSHGGSIDLKFLQDLVQQANDRPKGIKARFGHPNMCSTALGTYLGRFRNFRLIEDAKVIGDLYLDDSAKIAPSGNLFEYILQMAEHNPDMLGASIVFEADDFETVDIEGIETDFFRLKTFRAADIVDDPAATDSLFSADSMAGQFTQLLDFNHDFTQWMLSHPANIKEFLSNYLTNNHMKFKPDIVSGFRKAFGLVSQPLTAPINVVASEDDPASKEVPASEPLTETVSGLDLPADLPAAALEPEADPQAAQSENDLVPDIPPQPPAESPEERFSQLEESFNHNIFILEERVLYLEDQLSKLSDLNQSLNNRLSARPTIPKDVTDPQVSTPGNTQKDETGKAILSQMPPDLRQKLK